MSTSWTAEQVTALAPDAESVKAGKGLSTAVKWSNLGANDEALWGECKGSGSKPYQTRVELSSPAFKCTCPSRKFPCKHSLGLLFLYAIDAGLFATTEPPGWVSEWLASRMERSEKRADKAAKPAEVDPAAREKREAKRAERVEEGLQELEQYMRDLVRSGLATAPQRPYSFWDKMSARLVDSQASGLARAVRQLGGIASSTGDWPRRLLEELGELQLLADAYRRIDSLPEALRADVQTAIGTPVRKEDVFTGGNRVEDTWQVWGQTLDEDLDGMRVQRAWLVGEATGHRALILDFTHRSQTMENVLVPGTSFAGGIAFYPSAVPMRALIASKTEVHSTFAAMHAQELEQELLRWRTAVSNHLCLAEMPMFLRDVTLHHHGEQRWQLMSAGGIAIPAKNTELRLWQLLAITNGEPGVVFGTWNGEEFTLLSALHGGSHFDLAPGKEPL